MRFGKTFTVCDPRPTQTIYPTLEIQEQPVSFPNELTSGILMDDAFDSWPQENGGLLLNGWNISDGSEIACFKPNGLFLFNQESVSKAWADHSIPIVTHQAVVIETIYMCSDPSLTEAGLHLMDEGRSSVFSLSHHSGKFQLSCNGKQVSLPVDFIAGQFYGIRITIDPIFHTLLLQIDSQTVANLPSPSSPIAYIGFGTGQKGNGFIQVVYLSAHAGYIVRERFFTALDGNIPDDWKVTGQPFLIELPYERNADVLSLQLTPDSAIETTFDSVRDSFSLSFSLFSDETTSFWCELIGESNQSTVLSLQDNRFSIILPDRSTTDIYTYRTHVWFVVELQVDCEANEYRLWINHKPITTIPFSEKQDISALRISCAKANVIVDDITLMPLAKPAEDYAPMPTPTDTGKHILGMLTCDLWRSGNHLGWDRINGFDGGGRKPLLGWYEDGNPEAADWEIKFLCEHGVSFRMPCWYRPAATAGHPFKTPLHSEGLHDGYFHAKYSNQLKFAVFLTLTRDDILGYEDYCKNILPYLIEYYFKDSRYIVIDNKPLIGIYDYRAFRDSLGGEEMVAEAMEKTRQCCRDLGFDGAWFISSLLALQTSENLEVANGCSDMTCAYGWGIPFSDSGRGQMSILEYTKNYEQVANLAASITTGFDFYPWMGSNASGTISPKEFSDLCRFVRDEYLPTHSVSKLVMLDNWNEYSEGHALCPSQQYGFTWLDIVRDTFATSMDHIDVYPTPRQLARIGLLYNTTRVLQHPARYPSLSSAEECASVWKLSPSASTASSVRPISFHNRCGNVRFENMSWRISCADERLFSVVEITVDGLLSFVPPYLEVSLRGEVTDWSGRVFFAVDDQEIDYVYQSRKMIPVYFDGVNTHFRCDIGRATKPNKNDISGKLTLLQIWFFSGGKDILLTGAKLLAPLDT